MNKLTRAVVMSGVAVAAGLTVATAPAVASPSAAAVPVVAEKSSPVAQVKYRERIHGFYNSPRTCQRVGKIGQFQRKWSKFQCYKVFRGFNRGDWALKVYSGWNFNNGPKGWPHRDNDHHGWPHRDNDRNGWPHRDNDRNGWPHQGGHDWKKR